MKPLSNRFLSVPGEHQRELCGLNAAGHWETMEKPATKAGFTWVIESLGLDCIQFWVPSAQGNQLSLDQAVALRWEMLGHATAPPPAKEWTHWVVAEENGRQLVASICFAGGQNASAWESPLPASFEISPRLLPIAPDGAAVWQELGRLVIAFKRGSSLLHFSTLTSRTADDLALSEIQQITQALEAGGCLGQIKRVDLWCDADDAFAGGITAAIGAPVFKGARPALQLPDDPCPLLPGGVARERVRVARGRRLQNIAIAAAACYLLVFAGWASWLGWRDHRVSQRRDVLARNLPQAQAVQVMRSRWLNLEPAVNPDSYAAELFHRVASLLPEEGICLKEFHLEKDRLIVAGEASTVAHEKKFQSDLTTNESLKQYHWNFPQPVILSDNRASFRAEGTLGESGGTP